MRAWTVTNSLSNGHAVVVAENEAQAVELLKAQYAAYYDWAGWEESMEEIDLTSPNVVPMGGYHEE